MIIVLASFLLGVLCGMVLLGVYVMWQAQKLDKQYVADRADKLVEEIEKISKIKKMFAEINQISEEQANLVSKLDSPSSGPAHSRYKNSLVSRIKELEEQKLDIFQSILDNGIDPIITVNDGNEMVDMRMSKVLEIRRAEIDEMKHIPSTDPKNPREKVSHLKLVKSEDDNEPDTTTIH